MISTIVAIILSKGYSMYLVSKWLPYSAMAIYPFILFRRKEDSENRVIINHEKIHHRQQLELLLIGFYIAYIFNYLVNMFRYRTHDKAYRQIIFEREAAKMETDTDYLKTRKLFAFIKF